MRKLFFGEGGGRRKREEPSALIFSPQRNEVIEFSQSLLKVSLRKPAYRQAGSIYSFLCVDKKRPKAFFTFSPNKERNSVLAKH
jgi:hypothetical protein